jgi:alpha-L-fucosidase
MKRIKAGFFAALTILCLAISLPNIYGQPTPDKKNAVRLGSESLQWFNEARYGMFIHWGIYSAAGRGEWVMNRERIPKDEYIQKYAHQFTADKFDAAQWCALAKKAGMKYIVLTTRHHDGFALWDTKTSTYNAMNYGPKRDLVKEFVTEARKAGLKIGFYYSVADWSHPDYPAANARDWPQAFADDASWKRFVDYYQRQVAELMTNYGKIDILWWDGCILGGNLPGTNINEQVLKMQPHILINDRNGGPFHYSTSEQKISAASGNEAWEACFTLNDNWGYHATDKSYKKPKEVLEKLITCAGSGGNLLLNIGPKADGSIPQESVDILMKTGDWLRRNGSFLSFSEKSGFEKLWNNSLLPSAKGQKLYLHFLSPATEDDFCYAEIKNKVTKAYFLDGGKPIAFQQQGERLILKNVKKDMKDNLINTVVVETEGKPQPIAVK